ncbi:dUTP diphosphatase [Virgibacillus salexigens]|uniref:dUTP diphosphatase n=1 Tax=Virgibacillus salexigens TaxID=61016 RepID=UPI00190936CA|nr:deoxyuridine 5'-triphosphate nucleotidohydrolase [Virgibacillus salexigens]
MNLNIKKLHPDAVLPKYAKQGDSGFDLVAIEDVIINPGETVLVKTGLAFDIPEGFELQVRPRSGITLKTKLRVQLGTIDSNYRGEVGVIVDSDIRNGMDIDYYTFCQCNYQWGGYLIKKGDRIAQAILAPVTTANFIEVDKLTETVRGTNGYGSTGTN